jgi:hypothetical protein
LRSALLAAAFFALLEYEGCVIVERWMGKKSTGMSTSFYDINRHAWRMVWVSDDGTSNDFEGTYRDSPHLFGVERRRENVGREEEVTSPHIGLSPITDDSSSQ